MPQIIESDGDIFESGCEALVNPVDAATGAQGAGLAKLFKQRFLAQCQWYQRHARAGFAEAGHVYFILPKEYDERTAAADWLIGQHRDVGEEPLVLFATTKSHWRRPSNLDIVASCCDALVEVVAELGIRSLAVPAMGCGEGGLDWADVRPLILAAAERMNCERVVVFGPKERR